MVTKEEIQSFIRAQVDKEFFDELGVLIPQTFQKALKEVEDLLIHTPHEDLRGHLRHSLVQEALAGMKRWSPLIKSTDPKGHNYVLLEMGVCASPQSCCLGRKKFVQQNIELN